MPKLSARARSRRGSATVELTILIPVLVLLGLVVATGARIGWARAQVVNAASAGARAATLQTSGAQAKVRSDEVVRADLATVNVPCAALVVSTDVSAFSRPAGQPGEVTTHVACDLELSDIAVPGFPGRLPVEVTASEPLDTYRGRTP